MYKSIKIYQIKPEKIYLLIDVYTIDLQEDNLCFFKKKSD